MSTRKGIRTPKGFYERISQVIRSLEPNSIFNCRKIQALVPEVSSNVVHVFFHRKRRAGWLDRVSHGQYRRGGIKIRTTLPKGLVAEAVWAVLFTRTPNEQLLGLAEIVGEVESYVGRPGVSMYRSVNSVIYYWTRDGHLERTGKYLEYRYRLKPDITERPVVRGR